MKRISTTLLCLGLAVSGIASSEDILLTPHMSADYTEMEDYQAICVAIGMYLKGCATGNSEDMKPAFLPQATVYWVEKGELKGGPIQILFDVIDAMPGAGNQSAVISSINIEKNIAQVRLETDKEGGPRYSDMFQMLKTKDGWKIMSKIYYSHR